MSVCPVSPGLTPFAFADYRSAGAALCLSPRGDMHTDIRAAPGFRRGRRTFFPHRGGYWIFMSSSSYDRVEQRAAELLPEEGRAGSAGPPAQGAGGPAPPG